MTRLSRFIYQLTRRHRSAYVKDDDVNTMSLSSNTSSSSTPSPSTQASSERATGHLHYDPTSNKKKNKGSGSPGTQQMEACLGIFDLVSLGVGSCLGTGMYLTAGIVASSLAGPGGVLSFLTAGLTSMLTGLCYAELAGRCPKSSGSAYMYAYVTAGELAAFIIGWGLVVEYVIGTAAGAVALSETLDSMCNGILSTYLKGVASFLGLPKLDLVAAAICLVLTALLASGAQMSAKVNNVLNLTNALVLVLFVIASVCLGSPDNWKAGGFFPMGLSGVVGAIPTCYFAFIGFDCLAATGAEARDPSTSIPLSILLSILLSSLAYVVVILTLTFDLPFYLLRPHTAMTDVFSQLNFAPGKYVMAVGAVSGELAATFGSLFPLPRVLMAMASDGLIFRRLGRVCPKRHTPLTATLLSGAVAMLMATFFRLTILIELVLIGTLLAYVIVTFALLHMRYVVPESPKPPPSPPLSAPPSASAAGSAACIPTSATGDAVVTVSEESTPSSKGASPGLAASTGTAIHHPEMAETTLSSKAEAGFSLECIQSGITTSSSGDSVPHPRNRGIASPSKKQQGMPRRLASSSFRKEGKRSLSLHNSSRYEDECKGRKKSGGFSNSVADHDCLGHSDDLSSSQETNFVGRQTLLSNFFSFRSKHAGKTNTYEAHPLLEMDAEDDEVADSENTLYEKSSLKTRSRQQTKANQRTPPNGKSYQKNSTSNTCPSLLKQCSRTERSNRPLLEQCSRTERSNCPPLWSRLVGVVDFVSATPFRIQALLYAVYGLVILLCLVASKLWRSMADGSWLSLGILGILSTILCVLVGILTFLPEFVNSNSFRAPLVPSLPIFVAMVNIFLMTSLSAVTWVLFGLWMSAGFLLYMLYGINHSEASMKSAATVTSSTAFSPDYPITIVQEDEGEESDDENTVLLSE